MTEAICLRSKSATLNRLFLTENLKETATGNLPAAVLFLHKLEKNIVKNAYFEKKIVTMHFFMYIPNWNSPISEP